MIHITGLPAISALDPTFSQLLALRYGQLGECDAISFLIVETGDLADTIEHALGFPLSEAPFEWVANHDGHILEAPVILDDDGASVVLIVPIRDGIDPALLALLRDQATPSQELTTEVP